MWSLAINYNILRCGSKSVLTLFLLPAGPTLHCTMHIGVLHSLLPFFLVLLQGWRPWEGFLEG